MANESVFRERVATMLRRELVRSGMTEQELADTLGVTRTHLKRLLLGQDGLNFQQVDRIVAALDAEWHIISRRKKDKEPTEYVPVVEGLRSAIKQALYERGMTQKQLADITETGPSTISDILRTSYGFSTDMTDRLLQGMRARVEIKLLLDDIDE